MGEREGRRLESILCSSLWLVLEKMLSKTFCIFIQILLTTAGHSSCQVHLLGWLHSTLWCAGQSRWDRDIDPSGGLTAGAKAFGAGCSTAAGLSSLATAFFSRRPGWPPPLCSCWLPLQCPGMVERLLAEQSQLSPQIPADCRGSRRCGSICWQGLHFWCCSGSWSSAPVSPAHCSCLVVAAAAAVLSSWLSSAHKTTASQEGCVGTSWHYNGKAKKDPEKDGRGESKASHIVSLKDEKWQQKQPCGTASPKDCPPHSLSSSAPSQFNTPYPICSTPKSTTSWARQGCWRRQPEKAEEGWKSSVAPTALA